MTRWDPRASRTGRVNGVNIGEAARVRILSRQAELDWVKSRLPGVDQDSSICVVHGIVGMGKTVFLSQVEQLAKKAGLQTVRVDARAQCLEPGNLAEEVLRRLEPRARGRRTDEHLLRLADALREPTVLLCDHVDEVKGLLAYVREIFIPALPAQGVLLVLALRSDPPLDWYADPVLAGRLHALALDGWTLGDTMDYLKRTGMDDAAERRRVWQETRGFPLAVAHAACANVEGQGASPERRRAEVASLFWHEVPPRSNDLLEALAFVRTSTQGTLEQVLGERISPQAFGSLASLSLVRRGEAGLAIDRYARMYLLGDLKARDPERFRRLWRNAMGVVADRLRQGASARSFYAGAFDLASLSVQASDVLAFPGMSHGLGLLASKPLPWGSPSPSDGRALHRVLDRGIAPRFEPADPMLSPHELLDFVLAHTPEWVRVARTSDDGRPVAFYTMVPLQSETLEMLPDRVLARSLGMHERVGLGRADGGETVLCLMACIPPDEDAHPFAEMLFSMHAAGWTELDGGKRCLLFSNVPEVSAYYRQLGYTELSCPRDAVVSSVFSLDGRGMGMAAWLMRRLVQEDEPVGVAGQVTAKAVRAALSRMHSLEALAHSELAALVGCDGLGLRDLLAALLTDVPAPSPLDGADQQLLRLTYLQPHRTATSLAQQVHMGRSTYYRHLERATEALAEAIARRVDGTAGPSTRADRGA
jgi:hypothetical protein